MKLKFTKMHGCGNDFVVVDARELKGADWKSLSPKLLDRRFGIGADQLLVLSPSGTSDIRMQTFERDGGESEMCGNGIRCAALLLRDRGLKKNMISFETLGGMKAVDVTSIDKIRVDMGPPVFEAEWAQTIDVGGKKIQFFPVSMGNPHAVIFVERESELEWVTTIGPAMEKNPRFPQRTNVEFVHTRDESTAVVRVWERGAGETLACGTGACAAGVAFIREKKAKSPVKLQFRGGPLEVSWNPGSSVTLAGPATYVFEGEIDV